MTAPFGGGHMATAKVIAASLTQRYGDSYDVQICDITKEVELPMQTQKLFAPSYAMSVRSLSAYPYRFFFNFAHSNPRLVSRFFTAVYHESGIKLFERYQPDIIVSTFPIISYIVHRLTTEGHVPSVPVISIITDAGDVHKLWLMGVEDAVLVSTPETLEYAKRLGVPENTLHYLGFPVSPLYNNLPPRVEARKSLGLKEMPTILFTNGGMGLSPAKMLRLARKLSKRNLQAQYIFVCGTNKALREDIEALSFTSPVLICGYVNTMPEYMAACDIVVGKAGWITLYEAMVAKRPTIILDIVPGQEEPNAEYVARHGLGIVERDPELIVALLEYYTADITRLETFEQAFERLGLNPYASDTIADFIVQRFDSAHPAPDKH